MSIKNSKRSLIKSIITSKKERDVAAKRILLYSMIIIIIVFALKEILNKFLPHNPLLNFQHSALYTILLAICAASLYHFLIELNSKSSYLNKQANFKCIFDCSSIPSDDVAIVIPSIPISNDPECILALNNGNNEHEENKMDILKELLRAGTLNSSSKSDIKAAHYITSSFAKIGLELPVIIWDYEAIEELKNTEKSRFKTFIAIGLFSNLLTLYLKELETSGELRKSFHIDREKNDYTDDENYKVENKIFIGRNGNRNPHYATYFFNAGKFKLKDGDNELALFAKAIINHGCKNSSKSIIICGGIGEKGSEVLSKNISNKWENLIYSNYANLDKNICIHNEDFAILYKVKHPEHSAPSIEFVSACPNAHCLNEKQNNIIKTS